MDFINELAYLNSYKTQAQWFSAVEKLITKYGFSQVLIGLLPKYDAELSTATIASNYSTVWRKHYDTQGYASIDPTVLHSLKSLKPILWEDSLYESKHQLEFLEEAKAYNLSKGITLPLHGPQGQFGIFSLATNETNLIEAHEQINLAIPNLMIFKDIIFQSILDNPNNFIPNKPIDLTTREKEILKWCAVGKSSWDISRICGCSEANINYHFSNINTKFGVSSRRAAAVKAVSLGLINL